jgi:hypothetical protein
VILMTRPSTLRLGAWIPAMLALAAAPVLLAQDVKQTKLDTAKARAEAKPASGSIDEALNLAYKAREKFRTVRDYRCTFIKREQVDGKLLPREFVEMKARTRPFSIYLKWQTPYDGREVIYVHGQNDGKLLAHGTGVEKVVGGTVSLDPNGNKAMENCRHAITEAGIGNLIDQLISSGEAEKKLGKSQVEIRQNAKVDGRVCWLVKSTHPNDPKRFPYHRTKVFFDKEHGLPIRFEGYAAPKANSGPDGELIEEYTYRDLELNAGLTAMDFSVDNPNYQFGRL